ncbi:MAG: hypothetical protein ACLFVP_03225 [Candidatus Bathyarchaeia archaeon]
MIEFMGGIMGTQKPYKADTYVKIIEDAEKKGCSYCNIAFPRESIKTDIKRFSQEVLSCYR